jgi:type II secretory pathway component PulK
MKHFVTAVSEELIPGRFGRININTADPAVLAALLPAHKTDLAREMSTYRTQKSGSVFVHDLSRPIWYKEASGLEDVVIPASWITLSSDVFRIRSVATAGVHIRTVTAVVIREKDSDSGTYRCRILYRESDF